jgi:phage-related protein
MDAKASSVVSITAAAHGVSSRHSGETQLTEELEREEEQREPEQWVLTDREASAGDPGELPQGLVRRIMDLQQGGGPLPSEIRAYMEPRFGADFSSVRIHTDDQAGRTAQDIQAHAFTMGEHIAFAPGAYRPESTEGKKLLAHELTHVVQQRGGSEGATAQQKVRRIYIPGISEMVDAAGNFLADQGWRIVRSLNPALEPILRRGPFNWLKDQLGAAFNGIVDRINRLNPQAKLEQLTTVFGALVERASVIVGALISGDCGPLFSALNQLKTFVTEVAGQAWNRLTEFLSPVGDFFSNIWSSYGAPAIRWLQDFAGDLWGTITQFGRDIWNWTQPVRDQVGAAWNWVKEKIFGSEEQGSDGDSEGGLVGWVTSKAGEAWDWVKERTRPVWEPVSSALQTVRELIPPQFVSDLGESMRGLSENLNQTGEQMDGGASVAENRQALASALPTVQQVLVMIRGRIVSARGWIINTVGSLSRGFSGLIGRLRSNTLLSLLANALSWLEGAATRLTSWVQERVAGLFDWVVRAFDFLSPFVEKILTTVRQVISVVGDLMQLPQLILGSIWNLIPECIRDPIKDFLVNQILRRIPVFSSLLELPDIWARVQATAMRIMRQLFVDGNLAGAAWSFFSSILRLIGLPPELVVQVLAKAASAIGDILTNPIGFLINTLRAVKEGFSRFFGNILRHLMSGIAGWLFGHMRDAGITPPQDFSLRSILELVMQILGISVERVLERLGRRIGRENIDRLRRMLDMATGVWSWVSILIREGPAGLWREVRERLSGLWNQVLSSVVAWVNRVVIQRVTTWLLSMLDPSGIMAVVNSLIAIYRAIESFVQYLRQMLEVVNTVLDGINGIARGAIGQAAGFLENALSRSLPIAIGFLANQLGLGGLGRRIREMVGAVRERVDGAIDWLIDRALRGGRAFLNLLRRGAAAVRGGVARLREWWRSRRRFRAGGEEHSLYFQGSGSQARLMIASDPTEYSRFLNNLTVPAARQGDKTNAVRIAREIEALITASRSGGGSGTSSGSTAGADDNATQIQAKLEQLVPITARLFPDGSDVDAVIRPFVGQPLNTFQSAVSSAPLNQYYLVTSAGQIRRRAGQTETAPKLRVVDGLVQRPDTQPVMHWDANPSDSGGSGTSVWLGAYSGRGTNPASVAYGLDANGHLIGAQFGGSNGVTNISPMQRKVNSPVYSSFENALKNMMVGSNSDSKIRVRMIVTEEGSYAGRSSDWTNYTSQPTTQAAVTSLRGDLSRLNPADIGTYLSTRPERYQIQISGYQEVLKINGNTRFVDVSNPPANASATLDNPISDTRASTLSMGGLSSTVNSNLNAIRQALDSM